jgi:uncharacterized protein YjiS (DUF1127 family)
MSHAKAMTSRPNLLSGPRPFELFSRAFDTMLLWQERHEVRRRFLQLDDRMLRDIGMSPDQAHELAQRPFWRA